MKRKGVRIDEEEGRKRERGEEEENGIEGRMRGTGEIERGKRDRK